MTRFAKVFKSDGQNRDVVIWRVFLIHFPGQNLFSKPQITKQFYSIYVADGDAILESGAHVVQDDFSAARVYYALPQKGNKHQLHQLHSTHIS